MKWKLVSLAAFTKASLEMKLLLLNPLPLHMLQDRPACKHAGRFFKLCLLATIQCGQSHVSEIRFGTSFCIELHVDVPRRQGDAQHLQESVMSNPMTIVSSRITPFQLPPGTVHLSVGNVSLGL